MPVTAPVIPESEALYNLLMQGIEPDLTTDQIPLIEQKYSGETPEQRQARIERYEQAFESYEKVLDAYLLELQSKVAVFRKQVIGEAENTSRSEEAGQLASIESHFAK